METGSCLVDPFWFWSNTEQLALDLALGTDGLLGQSQFTSWTDPGAGCSGFRPGNMFQVGERWWETGEGRMEVVAGVGVGWVSQENPEKRESRRRSQMTAFALLRL